MDDLLADFIAETLDAVTTLDGDLVHLEKTPDDVECLARIFRVFHSMKGACGFLGLTALGEAAHDGEQTLDELRSKTRVVNREAISDILAVTDRVKDILAHLNDAPAERVIVKAPSDSVRIRIGALDRVMDTMAELSVLRHQSPPSQQRLEAAFDDLQSSVLGTRLMPFDSLWRKLPRLVRDITQSLKKEVTLEMTGGATEIDRPVLEKLEEALVHLVRNALDHGIETPEERTNLGKNRQGVLTLHAQPQNGAIVVTLRDDGRGLDPKRLVAQAIKKKLLTAQQAEQLSPQDAVELIFRRGFSTVDRVTSTSGRGIGMDVVRENLSVIGGHIAIDSTPGTGTTITLTVPLTLAIMPCLMVALGETSFALPLRHLRQLVKCDALSPILHWQSGVIPLLDIQPVLGMTKTDFSYAAIVQSGSRIFAIGLTSLHDVRDIVVKSLPPLLRESGYFSGQTLLGDGSAVFILEPDSFIPFITEQHHDRNAVLPHRHA
jgi:two-component system chemotaxis sensor kinase CheA